MSSASRPSASPTSTSSHPSPTPDADDRRHRARRQRRRRAGPRSRSSSPSCSARPAPSSPASTPTAAGEPSARAGPGARRARRGPPVPHHLLRRDHEHLRDPHRASSTAWPRTAPVSPRCSPTTGSASARSLENLRDVAADAAGRRRRHPGPARRRPGLPRHHRRPGRGPEAQPRLPPRATSATVIRTLGQDGPLGDLAATIRNGPDRASATSPAPVDHEADGPWVRVNLIVPTAGDPDPPTYVPPQLAPGRPHGGAPAARACRPPAPDAVRPVRHRVETGPSELRRRRRHAGHRAAASSSAVVLVLLAGPP